MFTVRLFQSSAAKSGANTGAWLELKNTTYKGAVSHLMRHSGASRPGTHLLPALNRTNLNLLNQQIMFPVPAATVSWYGACNRHGY
jgi:hypothetical protein